MDYPPTADAPSLRDNLTREVHQSHQPGTSFYSNPGFNLLEVLIEDVTGRDFAEHLRSEILEPLGMHRSSFDWTEDLGRASPPGHGIDGAPVEAYVYPERASGGQLATVDDIGRFVAAGLRTDVDSTQAVLGADSIRELFTPVVAMGGICRAVSDAHGLRHVRLPRRGTLAWRRPPGRGHGPGAHGARTTRHRSPSCVIECPLMQTVLMRAADGKGCVSCRLGAAL